MRLLWKDETVEMPELDPPDDFLYAWEAVREIRELIAAGTIQYTPEGIRRWQNGGMTQAENLRRQMMVESVKRILRGRRIAEAESAFQERYEEHLRGPRQQAALMVARACVRRGAEIKNLHPSINIPINP